MNNPILKIEATTKGFYIYPEIAINEYQYIYRAADGVFWDKDEKFFYINEPDKWSIETFFNQVVSVVYDEYGSLLKLSDNTKTENISQNELVKIIELYSYFQMRYDTKFEYVYVEDNGNIRELNLAERIYLRTHYSGGDGARPYIKPNYNFMTPDNKISGYISRDKVKNMDIIFGGVYSMNNYLNELKSIISLGYSIDYKNIEYLRLLIFA